MERARRSWGRARLVIGAWLVVGVGQQVGCKRAAERPAPTAMASTSASTSGLARAPSPSASTSAATAASASNAAPAASSSAPTRLRHDEALTRLPAPALVSVGAWNLASAALDAAPASDAEKPAHRLARARVAVGLCTKTEGERALSEVTFLRSQPIGASISYELSALEVDAMACAGKVQEALSAPAPHGLRHRKGAVASRALASALATSGDVEGARHALDLALPEASKAGLPVATLVRERVAFDRKLGDTTALASDLRRLWKEFPAAFDAEGAPPPSDPTIAEAFARADALAAEGRADDALAAVALAAKLGAGARPIARAKGRVLYAAKAYAKAAPALREAAALATDEDAIDDAFHAARAQSRAGDDDGAIAAYDAIAAKNPHARWGAEAAFLAANLRYLHGRYTDAISAFDRYLAGPSSHGGGQVGNVREARRGRAIAMLASGRAQDARRAFEQLAEAERDDAGVRARFRLLAAIARIKLGDISGARGELATIAASLPLDWPGLAARARLIALGDVPPAWPTLPSAPPAATLPSPLDLLAAAGLSMDAQARVERDGALAPHETRARCAFARALDDGALAYRLGLSLRAEGPFDADSMRCGYAEPFRPFVEALEIRDELPQGFVHAILRQESAFRLLVVSPAGAVGIAQFMPQTAVATAKKLGRELDPTDLRAMQAPDLQLNLAASHLGELLDALAPNGRAPRGDAVALAAAAYNAGLPAVSRWLGEVGNSLDADVFVERIPFVETRGYVVRVMGHLARYQLLRGGSPLLPPHSFAFAADAIKSVR